MNSVQPAWHKRSPRASHESSRCPQISKNPEIMVGTQFHRRQPHLHRAIRCLMNAWPSLRFDGNSASRQPISTCSRSDADRESPTRPVLRKKTDRPADQQCNSLKKRPIFQSKKKQRIVITVPAMPICRAQLAFTHCGGCRIFFPVWGWEHRLEVAGLVVCTSKNSNGRCASSSSITQPGTAFYQPLTTLNFQRFQICYREYSPEGDRYRLMVSRVW